MKTKFTLLAMTVMMLSVTAQTDITSKINRTEVRPVFDPDPLAHMQAGPLKHTQLIDANIGSTWYDLQNYGSMQQRMYAFPDGTIGAAWMMAFSQPDWEDRGIGYNYYNGNSWGMEPTTSVASIRTGWAAYAPLGENGEVTVGHALPSDDWVLWFSKRENKGTGDWEEFQLEGPEPGVGIVWPSMVTSGPDHDVIHVLALTYGNPYMNQENALVYSRSSDGGETWDIFNHHFDELGEDYFLKVEADGFAWAAPKGNTLAFAVGFDIAHGCIMKSTDGGDNWEFTEVFNNPMYPPAGGATPPWGAGDGAISCAIDNQDNVHLTFGRMRHVYDDAGTLLYYPVTDGLIYWTEGMPPLDTTVISTYTLEYLEQGGHLVGWVPDIALLGEFPSYYVSLTSFPQMLIDNSNRIFVLFSSIMPTFTNGAWTYRHIVGNGSVDGGITWEGMRDLNEELVYIFSECVYPVLAPTLHGDAFHLFFQHDAEPGIFVWAAQQTAAGENMMTYISKPASFLVGTDEHQQGVSPVEVSQNYPNPFSSETIIGVTLNRPSHVSFTVYDATGKTIFFRNYGKVTQQRLPIRFENPGLPAGVYFYTVSTNLGETTGRMVVK